MRRSRLLLGMALASSLDASAGTIIAHILCLAFGRQPTLLTYGIGMLAALAPDISIPALNVMSRFMKVSHHRELTHYPLMIIPLFAVLAWFSLFWALLVSLCLLAHFLDDTADPGGIKWLAPFSQKRFQFLATEIVPLTLELWLEKYYLQPTIKSVMAVTLSSVAIGILMFYGWHEYSSSSLY